MTDKRIVLTTAETQEEARRIARQLVDQELAACVNIIPGIESIFKWQGKTDAAQEWLLLIKTKEAAFETVRETIERGHSYDVPEVLSLTIDDGSDGYLRWIEESVK